VKVHPLLKKPKLKNCDICNTGNKETSKFCRVCGVSLTPVKPSSTHVHVDSPVPTISKIDSVKTDIVESPTKSPSNSANSTPKSVTTPSNPQVEQVISTTTATGSPVIKKKICKYSGAHISR